MDRIAKIATRVFALTTIALIVVEFLFVPVRDRYRFMGWAELSLAAMFLSVGVERFQQQRAGGTLYVGVGVFLVVVVLIGFVIMPTHVR